MRPQAIDSNQQILPGPQILMEFAQRYNKEGYPVYAVVAGLAQELSLDDAEVIQFGNTAFISHYDNDKSEVSMRALNVDTAKNYINNVENYVAYIYRRGVKTIITSYDDEAITSVIKTTMKRIGSNNKNLDASVSFKKDGDETIATIRLNEEDEK